MREMTRAQKIRAFNESNAPFYLVDHTDEVSLCCVFHPMPDSVFSLGQEAFNRYAFAYCSSLIDFCTSCFNRLEDHAFYCCRSLERVVPRGCVSYDRSVFDGCTSLKARMCTLPSHIV